MAAALVDEAERATHSDWQRILLANAWVQLGDARAALADGERALDGYRSPVVDMMRESVEKRRATIEQLAARLDEIERRREQKA